ncbi:MAG: potassium-transporting ATPase subunit KdpC [Myxococcales bacterium]|nr:potassium-transporting ATPase subunit KdpC [Myxococcales bacterium]
MPLLRPATALLALMTVLTGLVYPLAVTGASQLLFPRQAQGSLVEAEGRVVGSALIGQPFDEPRYVWGRPSATSPFSYNAASSTGTNLGPSNPVLVEAVRERVAALRAADPGARGVPVPIDLVTASGSGLDPHVSPAAALYQVPRVARARRLSEAVVRAIVLAHVEDRTFGILGEQRVNVLLLNLALDAEARRGDAPK